MNEPDDRAELFIFDVRSGDLRRFDEPATTFIDAAWLNDASLAVITAPALRKVMYLNTLKPAKVL